MEALFIGSCLRRGSNDTVMNVQVQQVDFLFGQFIQSLDSRSVLVMIWKSELMFYGFGLHLKVQTHITYNLKNLN